MAFARNLLFAVAFAACGIAPAIAQAPATAPGSAPSPAAPPPAAAATDPFGADITLVEKNAVSTKGAGTWDNALDILIDAYKTLYAYLEKQGVKPAGPAMTVYTATDDTGFQYQALVPISAMLKDPPKGDIEAAQTPRGKMLHFVHRGSYDGMDSTYEAITNYLDEKKLEAQDMFIEEYVTDLLTTPEDKLVVNVYVPIK